MAPVRRTKGLGASLTNADNSPYSKSKSSVVVSVPAVKTIANEGDVILEVGSEKAGFRVMSHMLRAASKTFSVTFGPLFQEGQDLDRHQPKTIPLPEDDPEAMELLLNIIHLRNRLVPPRLSHDKLLTLASHDKLLTFASHVEKYALYDTVHLAAMIWFQDREISGQDVGMETYDDLVSAMRMNHLKGFQIASRRLIFRDSTPYHAICHMFTDEDLWRVAYFLEAKRASIRAMLINVIRIVGRYWFKRDCDCGFWIAVGDKCKAITDGIEDETLPCSAISDIWELVEHLSPDSAAVAAMDRNSCPSDHFHERSSGGTVVRLLYEGLKKEASSLHKVPFWLCLPCTRKGQETLDGHEGDFCEADKAEEEHLDGLANGNEER